MKWMCFDLLVLQFPNLLLNEILSLTAFARWKAFKVQTQRFLLELRGSTAFKASSAFQHRNSSWRSIFSFIIKVTPPATGTPRMPRVGLLACLCTAGVGLDDPCGTAWDIPWLHGLLWRWKVFGWLEVVQEVWPLNFSFGYRNSSPSHSQKQH